MPLKNDLQSHLREEILTFSSSAHNKFHKDQGISIENYIWQTPHAKERAQSSQDGSLFHD
jgi:hypothetical protein